MTDDQQLDETWLDPEARAALRAVIPDVMAPASAALYARWWQLETWLRELIYVELRARLGTAWTDQVRSATGRQQQDAAFTHMTGPDNDNPLAYLDYSQLLQIIEADWPAFSPVLIEQNSWNGRQDDLKRIRHRIGHLRKPHPDDLTRLEQTLRDLERGAFIACASYNDHRAPDPDDHHDPVSRGWLAGRHPVARRLIDHAARQYNTRLFVRTSRRPLVSTPPDLTSAPGVLWRVDYYVNGRTVDVAALWHDSALDQARPLLIHMLADSPHHVGFTFSAADDAVQISDAIGDTFDAVLENADPTMRYDYRDNAGWQRDIGNIDYRLITNSGWNIVGPDTLPISMFGSGGKVTSRPKW
jgi:hypothetical protein